MSKLNSDAGGEYPLQKRFARMSAKATVNQLRFVPETTLVANLCGITPKYNRAELSVREVTKRFE